MNIEDYKKYITEETLMGPNSVRILGELLEKHPLHLNSDDIVLDLGCGTGLTSLVIAIETGAKVFANDLWVSAEENGKRFAKWNIDEQIMPVCEDAADLHFDKKMFPAAFSIDSYHYFGGDKDFFGEKILPFLKDGATVLIGIPGLKDEYAGRGEDLLSDWLGDDTKMFKSPKQWKELIGNANRIETVEAWETDYFDEAWEDWLLSDKKFAQSDKEYFDSIIKPYTCIVGIYIKLK